eukprot:INCI17593.1.p2 GENE.INCI17593.1~~INCI17593.1.p2  ORF type:complete len:359 (-),score=54.82 INCI17593.1:3271-4347(-)
MAAAGRQIFPSVPSAAAATAAAATTAAASSGGGGGASKEDEVVHSSLGSSQAAIFCSPETKLCLQLAIGKWLDLYVLKAKRLIGEFLLGQNLFGSDKAGSEVPGGHDEGEGRRVVVSVEAMGSGKVLVPHIEVLDTNTIRELKLLIVSKVPSLPATTTRIFKGHGGYELARENQTLYSYGMQDKAIIVATTSMDDRTALTALFYVTNGPAWDRSARKHWRNPNKPIQKWSRVGLFVLGPHFGRVRQLSLSNCGLSGPIPAVIGQLDKLESLHMDHNRLTGQIPSEIGKLTILRNSRDYEVGQLLPGLDLSHNCLTGSVPPEVAALCKNAVVALNDNANGDKVLDTKGLALVPGRRFFR